MFTDTHCHLNHDRFNDDRTVVLQRARDADVTRMLCIGFDLDSSRRAVQISRDTESVFACVGIHPESAGEWNPEILLALEEIVHTPANKVRAWGEIGLDYYRDGVSRAVQIEVFAAQIEAAQHISPNLPLIIHCREALNDILDVLQEAHTPAPVILHCWTGTREEARRPLDAGYYFGIGGVATFKKSEAVREAMHLLPVDRILLETDCPYLAPQPVRGRRNEPSFIPLIAQTVADVKDIPLEQVADITSATAHALFQW